MTTWINNGSGVQIGYANGSREYKAGDIGHARAWTASNVVGVRPAFLIEIEEREY